MWLTVTWLKLHAVVFPLGGIWSPVFQHVIIGEGIDICGLFLKNLGEILKRTSVTSRLKFAIWGCIPVLDHLCAPKTRKV